MDISTDQRVREGFLGEVMLSGILKDQQELADWKRGRESARYV